LISLGTDNILNRWQKNHSPDKITNEIKQATETGNTEILTTFWCFVAKCTMNCSTCSMKEMFGTKTLINNNIYSPQINKNIDHLITNKIQCFKLYGHLK